VSAADGYIPPLDTSRQDAGRRTSHDRAQVDDFVLSVEREGEQVPVNLVKSGAGRPEPITLQTREIERYRHLEALAVIAQINLIPDALVSRPANNFTSHDDFP
jgi:hypothetical protein